VIIFIHVPKTGGSSLTTILNYEYGDNFSRVENKKSLKDAMAQSDIECIAGHFNYGWHKLIKGECKYITILRNPIDRIISHYFFVLRSPEHEVYKKIINSNEDLKKVFGKNIKVAGGKEKMAKLMHKKVGIVKYVLSGLTDQTENGQTRMLSGLDAPFGKCNKEMLLAAKKNLSDDFIAVGLTERFGESVQLFRRKLKWKRDYTAAVENKRVDLSISSKFDNESIEYIKSFNRFDIELYNYALMLFGKEQCMV